MEQFYFEQELQINMNSTLKWCGDCISWGVIGATIVGWLPNIAAGLSIIWTLIQIWAWYKNKKVD